MSDHGYVHGYDEREAARLADQADTLARLLHHDSIFEPGASILEAGCGVGAQTVHLARLNPQAKITCVDISAQSLQKARENMEARGFGQVEFIHGDIRKISLKPQSFDHVFVCFVLEHLEDPMAILKCLKTLLRPGGTITVIEGDHGSVYFHPESDPARKAIACQVELQRRAGGNALIGRELYPLLTAAGFDGVKVSPRMVYVDGSQPGLIEGFTLNTFTAMVEGVEEKAVNAGLLDRETFKEGIDGLKRTASSDGVFCYTFFKAVASV